MLAFDMPAGVTFNAFVVSLVATAAVHFGDVADRSYGEKPLANVAAASLHGASVSGRASRR